ncbi:MAG: hypothetical protein HZA28_04205 [Candidatus Omnitrophica bacterium]|nr:hypothetical protein [Candidatus Omnitrophota bacterium]
MKRIGIAASKISKGNTVFYNLCVVLIACLFSLFIFIVAGATIALALMLIGYIGTEVMGHEFQKNWYFVMAVCMAALTVVVVLFNVFAILMNIRWTKKS